MDTQITTISPFLESKILQKWIQDSGFHHISFTTSSSGEHVNNYRLLMNFIASNALSTVTIGSIGPNISSCITGSVDFTSTKIVGAMNLSEGSVSPPTAIFPLFKNDTSRLRARKILLLDRSVSMAKVSKKNYFIICKDKPDFLQNFNTYW